MDICIAVRCGGRWATVGGPTRQPNNTSRNSKRKHNGALNYTELQTVYIRRPSTPWCAVLLFAVLRLCAQMWPLPYQGLPAHLVAVCCTQAAVVQRGLNNDLHQQQERKSILPGNQYEAYDVNPIPRFKWSHCGTNAACHLAYKCAKLSNCNTLNLKPFNIGDSILSQRTSIDDAMHDSRRHTNALAR